MDMTKNRLTASKPPAWTPHWAVEKVERDVVEMRNGRYVAALHAPSGKLPGGFLALERERRDESPYLMHYGPLDTVLKDSTSQRVPGQQIRLLRAQWSDSGLSALVHAVHGVHSAWCRAGCPIGALAQAAQDTQQAG